MSSFTEGRKEDKAGKTITIYAEAAKQHKKTGRSFCLPIVKPHGLFKL